MIDDVFLPLKIFGKNFPILKITNYVNIGGVALSNYKSCNLEIGNDINIQYLLLE
jgi:hypothetical protein